jgi:hypothetical protein
MTDGQGLTSYDDKLTADLIREAILALAGENMSDEKSHVLVN